MASVIASGTLSSPGFSRPSVSWCMLRLQGRSRVVLLQRTNARMGAHTNMHTRVWLLTKSSLPGFLFSPLKLFKGATVKGSHACMHACLHPIFCSNLIFPPRFLCSPLLSVQIYSSSRNMWIDGY